MTMVNKKDRSPAQIRRQDKEFRNKGKYAKVNPCYVCSKSAGEAYCSDSRTDSPDWGDVALVLCEPCATKGEALPEAEALAFYKNGKHWK